MSGKKNWETPKLTVIERSKPQEAVLYYCKYSTTKEGEGFSKTTFSCKSLSGYATCVVCSAQSAS